MTNSKSPPKNSEGTNFSRDLLPMIMWSLTVTLAVSLMIGGVVALLAWVILFGGEV